MAPLNQSLTSIIDKTEPNPLLVSTTNPKQQQQQQQNCFNLSQGTLRAKQSSPILYNVPQNLTFTPFSSHSISTSDASLSILHRVQANAHKGGFLGFTQDSPSNHLINSLGRFKNREFLSVFRFKMWWTSSWTGTSGSDLRPETQWVMLKIHCDYIAYIHCEGLVTSP
ncbi:unnamed protein product [Cochlearia groenlandica]